MEQNNKKNKLPVLFLILKILGIGLVLGGIIVLIVVKMVFPGFPMIGFGMVITMWGFIPNMQKVGIRTARYIQEQNKEDLKDIANTSAELNSEAVTKTASAVKEGFKDRMFCKHCGEKIDKDSKFCKFCGNALED